MIVDENDEPVDWRVNLRPAGDWLTQLWAPITEQMRAAAGAMLAAALNTPDVKAGLDKLRSFIPENWPAGVDLEQVAHVIQDDGLPLVWVPPARVVEAVLAAPDRDARIATLLSHAGELTEDCRRVLSSVTAERLTPQLPLAPRVLAAFEAGHHEAAQALAVVVTEGAIKDWITGKYDEVVEAVRFDPDHVPITWLRLQAAVAPLKSFRTRYFNEGPPPEALSRHMTVHYADAAHFTKANALVAVLLMTSVLRAIQEFEELPDHEKGEL